MYQETIRAEAARLGHIGANARHVEAWMRLAHPTLDGLSRAQFDAEILDALDCMDACTTTESESLARSYGLQEGA